MRIGIDLGGTKIEGIVLDNEGNISEKLRVDTPAESYTDTLNAICEVIGHLQNSNQLSVGIGSPGALSFPNEVMKNSNSVRLNGQPLKKDLEALLGYEVRLENDANCFALSEAHYGAAKSVRSVFGVILGTGCGGGVVIDKQLVTGPNSIAGEWGHNTIPVSVRELIAEDRTCYCGRQNCNETVLSGRGLQQSYKDLSGKEASAKSIAENARNGNAEAANCIDEYAQQLARCLSTVINVIDPHMIVLGGGLSNIQQLYELVPQYLEGHVFTDEIQTVISKPTFGDASGALGAACLWPAPE